MSGTITSNAEPSPGDERTEMVPFMASTSWREIVRPSPVPPNNFRVSSFPCVNSSKIRCCSPSDMPMPESLTVIRSFPSSASLALMPTPPDGVNLMALPQRFSNTCRNRRSSPRICAGMRIEMKLEISIPFACARGASSSVTDSIKAARSKGSSDTSMPCRSASEASSSSSTIDSRARAEDSAVRA